MIIEYKYTLIFKCIRMKNIFVHIGTTRTNRIKTDYYSETGPRLAACPLGSLFSPIVMLNYQITL